MDTPSSSVYQAMEQCHSDCVGWALNCCAFDSDEADDVLQATYLKILDGRALFKHRSSFKSWIFAVIRQTARERHRHRLLRRMLLGENRDDVQPQATPDAASSLADADEANRLANCLRTLPTRQRDILHLVFYQDLTIEESARVMRVSLGTARTHYERGKARMRALLNREYHR